MLLNFVRSSLQPMTRFACTTIHFLCGRRGSAKCIYTSCPQEMWFIAVHDIYVCTYIRRFGSLITRIYSPLHPCFYSNGWVFFPMIILTGSCSFIYHRKLQNDVSYKLPCMFIDSLLPCPTRPIGLEKKICISLGFTVHPCPRGRVVINVGLPCIIYYMRHNYYTKWGI